MTTEATETITKYRHPGLDITADAIYWRTLGYTCYANTDEVGGSPDGDYGSAKELLILGMQATGANDERAIAWALAERQRRREEGSRTAAAHAEAKAVAELAAAIRDSTEEAFLDRLLPRLSEKLQYALRQQLKGDVRR